MLTVVILMALLIIVAGVVENIAGSGVFASAFRKNLLNMKVWIVSLIFIVWLCRFPLIATSACNTQIVPNSRFGRPVTFGGAGGNVSNKMVRIATLSFFLLLLSAVLIMTFITEAGVTTQTLMLFGLMLPAQAVGIFVGERRRRGVSEFAFRQSVQAVPQFVGLTFLVC
jgi:hypothetical protein